MVLALIGELGAGKTTFVKGVAKGLGIKREILSPSFIIINRVRIKKGFFYHIDLYRIKNKQELMEIGILEILESLDGIVIIEWARKCLEFLPKETVKIFFEYLGESKREIRIEDGDIRKRRN